MSNNFLTKSRKTAIVFTIILALLAGSIYFLIEMGKRSRATPGVPTLSYSVEPSPLQSGQNFDLILQVNPNGASFNAFELYTSYDPSKVQFQNTSLPQNISSSYILITSAVNSTSNTITIIGTKTGSPFSGNANVELARVSMKVISGATGAVNYNWGSNTKIGSNINKELLNGVFTIGGGAGQPTIPPGGQGGPDLHLDTPALSSTSVVSRGQNVDVQVLLKTNNLPVKSLDFILPYDDARLTFQNLNDLIQNIVLNPNSGFNTQLVIRNVDTVAKKITIAMAVPSANGGPIPVNSPNDILIATLKFKVRSDAPDGQVSLLPSATSTIYNLQTQNILTCTGGVRFNVGTVAITNTPVPTNTPIPGLPTNTPTPRPPTNTPIPGFPTDTPIPEFPTDTPIPDFPTDTPMPFPTSTPFIPYPTTVPTITSVPNGVAMALDFTLRFQGIVAMPNRLATIPVKIMVLRNNSELDSAQSLSVNFTSDERGIWSGQAYFPSLLEASDYKILIKGPVHLQKRICDSRVDDPEPGKYSCIAGAIALSAGTNELNLTGTNLIAGDLPQQDGVANAYDVALTRNNLGSTDPTILAMADVNFDGIVDTQDYSLVIEALAVRTDDEL